MNKNQVIEINEIVNKREKYLKRIDDIENNIYILSKEKTNLEEYYDKHSKKFKKFLENNKNYKNYQENKI